MATRRHDQPEEPQGVRVGEPSPTGRSLPDPEVMHQLDLLQAELQGYYPDMAKRVEYIKHLMTGEP